MPNTAGLAAPTDAATQGYETAVAALRLVDALNSRPGGYVEDDAHRAASTALKAALAAFLVLTCPGGEQAYYIAAATEVYEDMFIEGHGVAEALRMFLDVGWQHTDGLMTGHDPYTESATEGRDQLTRGACLCGWQGQVYRTSATVLAGCDAALFEAQDDALTHARWPVVAPAMTLPL